MTKQLDVTVLVASPVLARMVTDFLYGEPRIGTVTVLRGLKHGKTPVKALGLFIIDSDLPECDEMVRAITEYNRKLPIVVMDTRRIVSPALNGSVRWAVKPHGMMNPTQARDQVRKSLTEALRAILYPESVSAPAFPATAGLSKSDPPTDPESDSLNLI